jgi:tellurite resistance protein
MALEARMERDGLDILKAKERGDEAQFFRRWDEELIKKLRERAHLEELSKALAEKLQVDDPGLLQRIVALGVTTDTGPAFLLAPLVQIAWAEGKVSAEEREVIHAIARERGIADGSPAHAKLLEWLRTRPADELFEVSEASIRTGISVLPPAERDARIKEMVAACRRVAAASGGSKLSRLLGLSSAVSEQEAAVLAAITAKLTQA